MKIKFAFYVVILLTTLGSCRSYFYLKHSAPIKNDENNTVHILKFSDEILNFTTYGDYQVNKVDKRYIFFKTKDIDEILKLNFQKKFSQQFLFTYTNMSVYNNIIGLYYDKISLNDVMKEYKAKPNINMENGVLYSYNFQKFNVIDIYRKTEKGVIRFININNPNVTDIDYKKYHIEINKLYFELNKNLWDNQFHTFE